MNTAKRNIASPKAKRQPPIDIIIPAAGKGYRMIGYGPKSLCEIFEKDTIFGRQSKLIKQSFQNYNIILVTGFESNKVMGKTPEDIIKVENTDFEDSNIVKSVGIGLRAALRDKVVIITGDLVFNKEALNFPLTESSLVMDFNSLSQYKGEGEVGCFINNGYVDGMSYASLSKWAQIAHFTGKELSLLKQLAWHPDNHRLLLWEVINKIIDAGGKFKAITPPGIKVFDIDTSTDLNTIKEIF